MRSCHRRMAGFYGMPNWPEDPGAVDLGARVLDVLAIPGHDSVSVALYDRQTAILFTGDSVYPGRLYIRDFAAFEKSNDRMLRFTAGKPVAHLLGNRIEQTRTPYTDYPVGTIYQPNEHELPLSRGALFEIQAGLAAMHGKPAAHGFQGLYAVARRPRLSRVAAEPQGIRGESATAARAHVGSNCAIGSEPSQKSAVMFRNRYRPRVA